MKSLLQIIVIGAGVAVVSASIVVIVKQSGRPNSRLARPDDPMPAAISNYSKTFKLNTNPPIWPTPTNGHSSPN